MVLFFINVIDNGGIKMYCNIYNDLKSYILGIKLKISKSKK